MTYSLWGNKEERLSLRNIGKHEVSSSVESSLVLMQAGLRNLLRGYNVESVLSSSNEEQFLHS
jgi:hypothetical protein